MKKKGGAFPSLAERLELPEEALSGVPRLTVTNGSRALIENHRGILEYNRERITVNFKKGQMCLSGRELRIAAMNREELLVRGELLDISWSGIWEN